MMEKKINYTKKAVKGVGVVFIFSIISAFVAYLARLVIARNLSVEDYGLFYSVLSVVLLIVLFEMLGLDDSLTKFIAEFNAKKKYWLIKKSIASVFMIYLVISLILALILFFLSGFLAQNYFKSTKAALMIPIFAIFLIFRPMTALIRGIREHEHLFFDGPFK